MTVYSYLKNNKLLSWSVVIYGFENDWLDLANVVDYAYFLIEFSSLTDEEINNLVRLAEDINDLRKPEAMDMLLSMTFINLNKNSVENRNPYILADLELLDQENISDDEKLDKLELLIAKYDYPPEMSQLSKYSQVPGSPIEAMKNLRNSLRSSLLA